MLEIPERFNLARWCLDRHVDAGKGARPALRYRGRSLTYAEVTADANRVGNALRGIGVDVEQRVAIALPDSPEFVATFFGAVKIGAVALPLSTLMREAEYAYELADSRAKAIVVSETLLPHVLAVRGSLPHLRHVIVVGAAAPAGCVAYDEVARAASPELTAEDTSKDDMCFWQYSSGTTGAPKAAVHLQHDLAITSARYGAHVVGMREDDRTFSLSKLFFSYGLTNSMVLPLAFGASALLLPERPEPRLVFETTRTERPTLFFAVPTAYAALLAAADQGADLSSVRLCVSAGEALPKALYQRWRERFGVEVLDGIGSTEIGYIVISNQPGRARPGTSGTVIPGYEAKLVDAAGASVAPGAVGDLVVQSDSTMAGYWNKHERTKRTLVGEWLATGDRYSVDADGYFTYAGRSDDMLRVGAQWVSPIEIEGVVLEHAAVLECAVVGRTDGDGLTRPVAHVVLRSGAAATPVLSAELDALIAARLPPFKRPRWIEFEHELPKTATGKIQRYRLRADREVG